MSKYNTVIIKSVNIQSWLTGHNYNSLQFGCAALEKENKNSIESTNAVKIHPDPHESTVVSSVQITLPQMFHFFAK